MTNGSIITTFILKVWELKSREFHIIVRRNGWRLIKSEGSHYIYEKNGFKYPVPFHGSKEVPEGLRKKMIKDMGLII